MINLTSRQLPNAVLIKGNYFPIHTDYRIWLEFWRQINRLSADGIFSLDFVFAGDVPTQIEQAFEQCMNFFVNSNPLPRAVDVNTAAIPYDYDVDSDCVYAAFMQQYGIDLVETDLHWHKFKALFDGIAEPCKLASIISARCYTGSDKDRVKLKQAWEIIALHEKDAYSCELEDALMNGGDVSHLLDTTAIHYDIHD